MKKFFYLSCLLGSCSLFSTTLNAKDQKDAPLYKKSDVPIEQRVDDLLKRMTLEEKIYQVNQYTLGNNNNPNNIGEVIKNIPAEIGSVIYFNQDPDLRNAFQKRAMEQSRLGIPVLFGFDVIHGYRTIYPIPLAQSCSWNLELTEKACAIAAQEARSSGVDWTFSPMLDVARDARWGRIAEGYGEDPYATSRYAEAAVKGYQGNDLKDQNHIAACLKHYVGYGASEAGRDYVYTEISRLTLWNTYLPPFEAGVNAGVATLMSGFNDISGIPASSNHYTLTEVLKNKWKHNGFTVSDWASVAQLINQGVAANRYEATEKAFAAGVDMDMVDNCYKEHLAQLIKDGKITNDRLDDAVRRILRIKFALGLFDQPYVKEKSRKERFLLPQNLEDIERLAEETMVLLKNNNHLLPLNNVQNIALIGPLVKNKEDLLGSWNGQGSADDVCSIYEAMSNEFKGKANILYAKGCDFEKSDSTQFAEAINIARQADVIVACLGEKRGWSGENASRTTISLPTVQEKLVTALKKTGKPLIVVLSNGRPLALGQVEQQADAIIEMWQLGVPGGKPLSGILSGRVNPSGKLSVTFPRSVGQIPIYYNRRPAARTGKQGRYQDLSSTPLYEFGHGLSFTTYQYGEIKASQNTIKKNEEITVSISVTNTGKRAGKETVHWFISDPSCSVSRPVKELKFFEKRTIEAGDTQTFHFVINPIKDLSFRDNDGNRILETGDYYILVKDKKYKITVTE